MKENRKRRGESREVSATPKGNKRAKVVEKTRSTVDDEVTARFLEDDNYVDMGVEAEQEKEFPSQSEEENESDSDEEEGEIIEECLMNNNSANVVGKDAWLLGVQGSPSSHAKKGTLLPARSEKNPGDQQKKDANVKTVAETCAIMQDFLLDKGLMDMPFSQEESLDFMQSKQKNRVNKVGRDGEMKKLTDASAVKRSLIPDPLKRNSGMESQSELTIYRRAIPQVTNASQTNNLEKDIEQFIKDSHDQLETDQINLNVQSDIAKENARKVSSSSDELMDTSDEADTAVMMGHFHISDGKDQNIADADNPEPGVSNDATSENCGGGSCRNYQECRKGQS